jgi:DNA polymerase III delta prime subunit
MSFLETIEPVKDTQSSHTLWCEKYRPVSLETYIGSEEIKSKVQQFASSNDIPHLLFHGTAGTGKTTIAKLITRLVKCDLLYINASDERGIDTIRDRVRNFASNMGFNKLKVIILDEADAITPDGQRALRNLMETFSLHSRFILTCNYKERIIEPLISRCQSFEIFPPSKKEVAASLLRILENEEVKFNKEGIVALVNAHYPDIRSIINSAQQCVTDKELVVSTNSVLSNDIGTQVVELLKSPNKKDSFKNIRQLLADNAPRRFERIYSALYEKVDEYAPEHVGMVITQIADAQLADAQVVDKEICFVACIYKILKTI